MFNVQFIGIDPGKAGAISFMLNDLHEVVDMPIIKHKKGQDEIDIKSIYMIINSKKARLSNAKVFAVIEEQQALTRFDPIKKRAVPQGAVSNFTIGYGYGILLTVLEVLEIPYYIVRPKDWQKVFGINKGKNKDTKSQSHDIAQRLFPSVDFTTPKGRILDGRSDAMLICQFAKYQYGKMTGNPMPMENFNDTTSSNKKLLITRRNRRQISIRT